MEARIRQQHQPNQGTPYPSRTGLARDFVPKRRSTSGVLPFLVSGGRCWPFAPRTIAKKAITSLPIKDNKIRPFDHIILLRAGDVERNPGPKTTPCTSCGATIRRDSGLTCSFRDCDRRCHKQQKCSGISRYKLQSSSWMCPTHNSDPLPTPN